jgi:hypothetical protein
MGFQQGEKLMYDPHADGQVPYPHQQKFQLDLLVDKKRWEDVQSILKIRGKLPKKP